MKLRFIGLLFLALLFLGLAGLSGPVLPAAGPAASSHHFDPQFKPKFKKVMVVVFENADYADALRQAGFAEVAFHGALLTNFHAETHPSQPNYLALVGGSTYGVNHDRSVDVSARNLADLLEARGKSWKAYLEGYPGGCYTGDRTGNYARKHNPMIEFSDIRQSPARCSRLAPAQELERDIRTDSLPDFSLYVPDLKNDGHDTGVAYAGRWLSEKLLPMLSGPLSKDLLLVVTFDESGSGSRDNRIYTAMIGAGVKPRTVSATRYDHASILRTIEERFHLSTLGASDAKSDPIENVWS